MKIENGGALLGVRGAFVVLAFGSAPAFAGIPQPWNDLLDQVPKANCKKVDANGNVNADHTRLVCGLTYIKTTCTTWFSDLLGCSGSVEIAARAAADNCVKSSGVDKAISAAFQAYGKAVAAWAKVPAEKDKRKCGGAVSGANDKLPSCFQKTGGAAGWKSQLAGHIRSLHVDVDNFKCPDGTKLNAAEQAKVDAALDIVRKHLATADSHLTKDWFDSSESSACQATAQLVFAKRLCLERKDVDRKEECVRLARESLALLKEQALSYVKSFGLQEEGAMSFVKCADVSVQDRVPAILQPPVRPCIAMVDAAANQSDCNKLEKIVKDVVACLAPARTAVANNRANLDRVSKDPVLKKSCEDVISKRAWVNVLDPIFGGGCAGFFQWLQSNSCDRVVGWVADKITTSKNELALCGKGFSKGLICGVVNGLLGMAELSCGAMEKILEGPCKYAAGVPIFGTPAAFICGLGRYVGGKLAEVGSCVKSLWALKGGWAVFHEIKDAVIEVGCDFVGGLVFEFLLSKGAGLASKLQNALKAIHHALSAVKNIDRANKIREAVQGLVGQVNQNCKTGLSLEGGGGGGTHGSGGGSGSGSDSVGGSGSGSVGGGGSGTAIKPPVKLQPGSCPPRLIKFTFPKISAGGGSEVGHPKEGGYYFRTGPSLSAKPHRMLGYCVEFKILGANIGGPGGPWMKVEVDGVTGFIKASGVVRGPQPCAKKSVK